MNYIELLNQFWQTRRSVRLTSNESDLYYFLLNESNIRMWENPFECSNGLICGSISITEKTLIDVRNRLQQKGFISVEAGQRKRKSPTYTLLYCKKVSIKDSKKVSITGSINDSITGSITPNLIGINENKTKTKKVEKSELDFPFSSDAFLEKWNQLLTIPKWKKKVKATLQLALNKLKDFEEEFVLEIIDQAIIGNWQGLVFSNTKSDYEKWKSDKKPNIANHDNKKKYEQF